MGPGSGQGSDMDSFAQERVEREPSPKSLIELSRKMPLLFPFDSKVTAVGQQAPASGSTGKVEPQEPPDAPRFTPLLAHPPRLRQISKNLYPFMG